MLTKIRVLEKNLHKWRYVISIFLPIILVFIIVITYVICLHYTCSLDRKVVEIFILLLFIPIYFISYIGPLLLIYKRSFSFNTEIETSSNIFYLLIFILVLVLVLTINLGMILYSTNSNDIYIIGYIAYIYTMLLYNRIIHIFVYRCLNKKSEISEITKLSVQ